MKQTKQHIKAKMLMSCFKNAALCVLLDMKINYYSTAIHSYSNNVTNEEETNAKFMTAGKCSRVKVEVSLSVSQGRMKKTAARRHTNITKQATLQQ